MELSKIDSRLYNTIALHLCTKKSMESHRRKAILLDVQSVYDVWTLSNRKVPPIENMCDGDMRFDIGVCNQIERTVLVKHVNAQGPLTTFVGMACMVGCRTKLHYVLNRRGMAPSYEQLHRLKKVLVSEHIVVGKPVISGLKPHRLCVFAVDNIDTTNRHGIVVNGRTGHGMHMTGIKDVISLKLDGDKGVAYVEGEVERKRDTVNDNMKFIDSHIPKKDDVDFGVYARIVIGEI